MSMSVGVNSLDAVPGVSEQSTRVSGRRLIAHFLDGLLYTLAAIVVVVPLFILAAVTDEHPVAMVVYIVGLVAVVTVGHVWFLVKLHEKTGQSPGKRAVGIKVVDANGGVPDRGALWRRFWPIIIEYLYVISWIGMMSSNRRQRFGDRWAGTYVVDAEA